MKHEISPFRQILIYCMYAFFAFLILSILIQKYEIKYNTRLDDCGIITKKYQTYVKARGGYYIEWIEIKAGRGHLKLRIPEEEYINNLIFKENNHICFKYVRLRFELLFIFSPQNKLRFYLIEAWQKK